MDQYSSLEEMMAGREKLVNGLLSKVYESREEQGVWAMVQLLKLQRDKLILDLASVDVKVDNNLEIARIQGKIELIGSFLRDVQTDLAKRKGSSRPDKILSDREEFMEEPSEKIEKTRGSRRKYQMKREAGILT